MRNHLEFKNERGMALNYLEVTLGLGKFSDQRLFQENYLLKGREFDGKVCHLPVQVF